MYLITGGCGFIGSHLAEALVGEGQPVRVFDNLSSGHERNLAAFRDRVEFVQGDIRDRKALDAAVRGVHSIFHEAALVSVFDSIQRPAECYEINVTGTIHLLAAARAAGARRLVFASSAAVYGNDPALPKGESMPPQPVSPYAVAKLVGEHYLSMYAEEYGMQAVALRYFNVYGPRQDPASPYSGVISKFADAVLAGRKPVVYGDGRQTRDFVFVGDIVRANLLAMRSARLGKGEVLNIGTGRQTSLLELLDAFSELTGREVGVEFRDARGGDVRHSVADISLARQELGFEPRHTLPQGLRELLQSLRLD